MWLWPGVFLYSFILLVGMFWYGLVWYGLVFNGVMMNLDSCQSPAIYRGVPKNATIWKTQNSVSIKYQLSTTLGKDL